MYKRKTLAQRMTRRGLLGGLTAGVGVWGTMAWQKGMTSPVALMAGSPEGPLTLNDASELSQTPIWRHLRAEGGAAMPGETIADALVEAANEGRSVIASAARHSMGGQSLAEDGLTITLDDTDIVIDEKDRRYYVGGGTRWHEVIKQLDKRGFSPAVMQSNNDFGVASTFSVNAHGWPAPYSGCGSTVRSFKITLADGTSIPCSRERNPEVFNAAMGGYGLIGVITEVELDMVPNQRLAPLFEEMKGDDFGPRFRDLVLAGDGVSMAYGRLDVSHDNFFKDALAITYRPEEDQSDLPAVQGSGLISKAARPLFRAQVNNERAKAIRWWVETEIGTRLGGSTTRNNLLNEPVITLDDKDPSRTDILHEYFIPPERLHEFLATCRNVIPNSYQQLLNVTLRYVAADTESLLSYAPEERIAAVMLFSQEKTDRAEGDMRRMTRLLIDGALAAGGSYYLPYRLHATKEQFVAAYPRAAEFTALKKKIDQQERFSNALWTTYLKDLA